MTTEVTVKVKHAEALAEPVMQQGDLQAELLVLRRRVAERTNDLDTAMALTTQASKAYEARGRIRAYIGSELHLISLREQRANPDDLAGIPKRIGELRELAVRSSASTTTSSTRSTARSRCTSGTRATW